MAKLFLSYSRSDAIRASRFADWLEREGHAVWRDDDDISGGASFSSEIEAALKDCDAVLVLWSQSSHDSAWVRDEAAVGRDAGKLLPFSLDQSEVPLGFRQYQTIDLSKWKRGEPLKAAQIRQGIAKFSADHRTVLADAQHSTGKTGRATRRPLVIAGVGLALTAAAGVTGYFIFKGAAEGTTTIAIVGESAGSSGTVLASTIAADMAPILAARAADATIVDSEARNGEKPDFQLGVAITPSKLGTEGTLALSSRRETGIIWSRNWPAAELPAVDLKRQMSFVASIAMLCALEGDQGRLYNRRGALGIYVQACARDSDSDSTADELINLLKKTVERAPDFAPAWARLATIYSRQIGLRRGSNEAVPSDLIKKSREAIENARNIEPNSARAFLAEGLAQGKATSALPFIDRAVNADPNDALVLIARADALMAVGRQADAIQDSRRSIELTPPSPAVRGKLIEILRKSGRSTEGLAELEKAEKLWPNDIEMRLARYNYEYAYGDVRIARKLLPSLANERTDLDDRMIETLQKLIDARIDPRPANIDRVLAHLRTAYEKQPSFGTTYLTALVIFHRADESFKLLSEPRFQSVIYTPNLFRPLFAPVRADRRFMKIAADLGLASYWRSSRKWPDFCADPGLPYDCKTEAAKYN